MEHTHKSAASEPPWQVFSLVSALVSKDVCEKVPQDKLSEVLTAKGNGVKVCSFRPSTYTLQGPFYQVREAEGILLDILQYKHGSTRKLVSQEHGDNAVDELVEGMDTLAIGSYDHSGTKQSSDMRLESCTLTEAPESSDQPKASPDKQKRTKRHNYDNENMFQTLGNMKPETSLSNNPANTSARSPSEMTGQHMVSTYKSSQGHVAVHVYFADITKLHVDAIVNAANKKLKNNVGVAGAIAQAAGEELHLQCKQFIKRNGELGVSKTAMTVAGHLPCTNVIHTVGPQKKHFDDNPQDCVKLLLDTFRNCLNVAECSQLKSIAIPAISSGHVGVPVPVVSQTMYMACEEFCTVQGKTSSLTDIHLVDISPEPLKALNIFFQADPQTFCLHNDVEQGTTLGIHKDGTTEADPRSISMHQASLQSMHGNQHRHTEGGAQLQDQRDVSAVSSYVESLKVEIASVGAAVSLNRVVYSNGEDSDVHLNGTGIKSNGEVVHPNDTGLKSMVHANDVGLTSNGKGAHPNDAGVNFNGAVVQPKGARVKSNGVSPDGDDVHPNGPSYRRNGDDVHPNGSGDPVPSNDVNKHPNGTAIKCNDPSHESPRKCRDEKPNSQNITEDGDKNNIENRNDNRSRMTVDKCPICFDDFPVAKLERLSCKHVFCDPCLQQAFAMKPVCPVCGEIYGIVTGTQPEGRMTCYVDKNVHLPGFKKTNGTIVILYDFPSGKQGKNHPNPGRRYSGTSRTAFLPDNDDGRSVLNFLKRAFDYRLVFTVGTSTTTGRSDQVTWNDIHHKTNIEGGPSSFGYPDDTYLSRVREELAAKGIK